MGIRQGVVTVTYMKYSVHALLISVREMWNVNDEALNFIFDKSLT